MLIPINQWSETKEREGMKKIQQASLLGLGDPNHIYRLLNEPERVKIDPATNEVWRKVSLKSADERKK